MTRTFHEWMIEGEAIYSEALKQHEALQVELLSLEERLERKKEEVNQIAQMIGKPPVEPSRRINAQIIDAPVTRQGMPVGSMARALTGRGI